MVEKKLVPPDGGFGWVIVGAVALHHLIAFTISQIFGLTFKELFKELGFSALDTSLIMNTNSAFALGFGLVNGTLIKYFGYRKVALLGATFITVGALLTANVNSFTGYFISYGIVTALGTGMGISSYSIALNSYFVKKRAKATSYAYTICGIGPVILPLLFSFLMETFGVRGALILFGSLIAHTYISALLLQPVKWHMKEDFVEEEKENFLDKEERDNCKSNRINTTLSEEEELRFQSSCDLYSPLGSSLMSLHNEVKEKRRASSFSANSVTNDHQLSGNKYCVTLEDNEKSREIDSPRGNVLDTITPSKREDINSNSNVDEKQYSLLKRIGQNIIEIFDLELLKDLTFLNMMIGMSLAAFAEINFALLTPFIMQDYGLNTQQIATFLSTQAVFDICFRFIAPYVSDIFKKSTRTMYLWSLVLLILSRSTLLLTNDYIPLLGCSTFIGLARGFRTIYWTLVLPSYVPIERLPAASGLQSTFNSVFIWIGGPFLGFIRDVSGSPKNSIIVINLVSATCFVMWCTEFAYKRYRSKRKEIKFGDVN